MNSCSIHIPDSCPWLQGNNGRVWRFLYMDSVRGGNFQNWTWRPWNSMRRMDSRQLRWRSIWRRYFRRWRFNTWVFIWSSMRGEPCKENRKEGLILPNSWISKETLGSKQTSLSRRIQRLSRSLLERSWYGGSTTIPIRTYGWKTSYIINSVKFDGIYLA